MSETAQTLVRAALRNIGAYASGEVPTATEEADALQSLKFMLRHWSANNLRLYYTETDTLSLTGATSYTIGSGGNCDTVRPASIRGGYILSGGINYPVRLLDEDQYRRLNTGLSGGVAEAIWYNPEYPLGVLYVFPPGTGTLYIDSLKPLTEPSLISSSVTFPPEYDEAIVYGLALRLCPEYGREPPALVMALAKSGLDSLESRNFASQINAVKPEIVKIAQRYNIDGG